MKPAITVVWFRRDLRLEDHKALHFALKESRNVLPVFIFDADILSSLESPYDARITFIHRAVAEMKNTLEQHGTTFWVAYGRPLEIFNKLRHSFSLEAVYFNRDYEPYALDRDRQVQGFLEEHGVPVKTYKDQVIFEAGEVLKNEGTPYTVYTPYMKKWREKMSGLKIEYNPVWNHASAFYQTKPAGMPSLSAMNFRESPMSFPPALVDEEVIRNYDRDRDFPALKGTSRLGMHLRFGTMSIRKVVARAFELNEVWLNQLVWREFFMMILWHFPRVVDRSFKTRYDDIEWRNDEADFEAWMKGKTGYPLVDAGMRELNHTGHMHNRVRMVTASFLTKHLLIDWRWGESYFAGKLLDYELSSNNGGWQWAAGSGCDAAPYFRIFNPSRQVERFDPELRYVEQWVPEYLTGDYLQPIVEHRFARERALRVYKNAVKR